MSCGTPVLAFDVGGLPDMVTNGVTGQLVPLSDTRKMGETIIDLIQKPDLRKSMGKEGRKIAEKEYSLSVQAGRYSDLYKELHLGNKSAFQTAPAESAIDTAWGHVRKKESLSVPVITAIGHSFEGIYDQVLMKVLKSIPVTLNILDGRYDTQIKDLRQQIKDMKQQMKELHVHLEARLVKIHTLTGLLEEAEANLDAKERAIDVLNTELAKLTEDINRLTEWLKDSEKRFSELRSRFPVRVMKKLKLI